MSSLVDALYDDEAWTDASGREHRIAEMNVQYCRNVVAFLKRHAEQLALAAGFAMVSMPMPDEHTVAFDMVTSDLGRELDRQSDDPVGWLNEQPLMEALRARIGEPVKEDPARAEFFEPGRTYGPDFIRFRCDAVTTHPATGERQALGWFRFSDGSWKAGQLGTADWADGSWGEGTEGGDVR